MGKGKQIPLGQNNLPSGGKRGDNWTPSSGSERMDVLGTAGQSIGLPAMDKQKALKWASEHGCPRGSLNVCWLLASDRDLEI